MSTHNHSRGAKPSPTKGLLERAAEVFDFRSALEGRNAPPLVVPDEAAGPISSPPLEEDVAAVPATEPVRARSWAGPVWPLDRELMAEKGFLLPGASVSGLSEEFRIIKRELLARIRGGREQEPLAQGNVVLVTSAHPGEGKTFCAVNLALSLAAENDVEVLLVDADVAKPDIPGSLGLDGGRGLMDALTDASLRIEDLVIRTDVPGFAVLPAGQASHNDAEHLASARTDALIAALVAGRPDRIVLFDSPPLLAASAASILAAHVGQTILIVRADSTTETALRDAAGLLGGSAHVQLLLNGVKFSASGRRFGTYYGKEE